MKILEKFKTIGNDGLGMPVNRLIVLSEIIFALAMTMLVFALEIPEIGLDDKAFIKVIQEDLQIFVIFLITFILLCLYWLGHVKRFSYIVSTNRAHLFIELMGLFFISVLPFTNGLISVHPEHRIVVVIYSVNLILIGVFAYWGWSYASHKHQLIKDEVDTGIIKEIKNELIIEPVVVAISLVVGLLKPSWFNAAMILIPIVHIVYTRYVVKRSDKALQ